MAQPKRCETILVNELLAFVQNKLDVMTEESLEQICATSYTEADITKAKQYLHDTANPRHVKLMTRREGGAKKSLSDIFRVFKSEDPDDVPTYVARDLNKLPPVTFDHVDATTLLKDIVLLKAEIRNINAKLEASERRSDELQRDLTSLREQNAASASLPAACANMRRDGDVQHDTAPTNATNATDTDGPRVDDPAASWASVIRSPPAKIPRIEPPAPRPPPAAPRTQKEVVARKPRRRPRRKSKPAPIVENEASQAATVPAAPKTVVDNDGFTLVQNRKSRQCRNQNRRGTATDAPTSLKASLPSAQLYVSRLDASTTSKDIEEYVRKSWPVYSQEPIDRVLVRQLEPKRPTTFRSFVIRVSKFQESVLLNPAFWPMGVVFRRYRPPSVVVTSK